VSLASAYLAFIEVLKKNEEELNKLITELAILLSSAFPVFP